MNEEREDENDGEKELVVIEQCADPQTRKQSEAMSAVLEYGRIADDGSLDVSQAQHYTDNQRGYTEEVFGRYGRVARYTTEVDEPSVEVVREPSGRGGETQKLVLQLIAEHATLNDDGSVDISSIASHESPNGRSFDSKVIAQNVGRATRVNIPYENRPIELRENDTDKSTNAGGTFDDPILNHLFSDSDVPSDPVAAFKRGWSLRDSLERNDGSEA